MKDKETQMHHRTTVLSSGILLMTVLACAPALGAVTFLRTQGQNMVDESGRKVLLQGVGLGNWLLPEGYMWRFGARRTGRGGSRRSSAI